MSQNKDYIQARDAFSWKPVSRYNFVGSALYKNAISCGDQPALIWTDGEEDVVWNFAQLKLEANKAAAVLRAQGLKRGDVLLLILSRELAWWQITLGCLQLGIIVSPGTTQLTAKDIAYRCKASGAKAIVGAHAQAAAIDEAVGNGNTIKLLVDNNRKGWVDFTKLMGETEPLEDVADTAVDDHAFYYFTSGTTGAPKMTVHGHGYPLGHETTGRFWISAGPGKVIWNISDTGWAKAAWTSLFAPWLQGAAIFALHQDGFDPQATLNALVKYPITTLCAPPTAYRFFVRHNVSEQRFQALEKCVSAGEPLNPEVIDLWQQQTGLSIFEGYGQTETVILCGSFDGMDIRPGSMGLPAPGIDLQVIDVNGVPRAAGEEGDIAVRVKPSPPHGLFLEYKNEPERTAACFRGNFYMTGDRATRDEDGYFWFVGRSDDVILSAGYRIGPFEVESVLFEHPAVAESAVVASPDPVRGEVVKAFIVLAGGYTASDNLVEELQNYVKGITAPYKYPRKIEFVDELPKTVSGKIRRKQLKQQEWADLPKS